MTSLHPQRHQIPSQILSFVVIAFVAIGMTAIAAAQTESIMTYLPTDASGFISDAAGNLYGTTTGGGNYNCNSSGVGCGTVFELSPAGDGTWTQTTLYSFNGGTDGEVPAGNVVFDKVGNLYGTTIYGGRLSGCLYQLGCGTVFKLSPNGLGGWTEKILYRFGGADGANPSGSLIIAGSSTIENPDLYGMTAAGGTACDGAGCGVVFRLSPHAGIWKYTLLHAFAGGADGFNPLGPLTRDIEGNLFGVAQHGGNVGSNCGPLGCGLIFKLRQHEQFYKGDWHETIVHTFDGTDGYQPNGGLLRKGPDNFYGTTWGGGAHGYGQVYEFSPTSEGWNEKTLYSFTGLHDGGGPNSSLVFDKSGNLLGTSNTGLANGCVGTEPYCGQVFTLTNTSSGWQISAQIGTTLVNPSSSALLVDKAGNIFGTAAASGDDDFGGSAYEIIP